MAGGPVFAPPCRPVTRRLCELFYVAISDLNHATAEERRATVTVHTSAGVLEESPCPLRTNFQVLVLGLQVLVLEPITSLTGQHHGMVHTVVSSH